MLRGLFMNLKLAVFITAVMFLSGCSELQMRQFGQVMKGTQAGQKAGANASSPTEAFLNGFQAGYDSTSGNR